jgi:hypothetical protein
VTRGAAPATGPPRPGCRHARASRLAKISASSGLTQPSSTTPRPPAFTRTPDYHPIIEAYCGQFGAEQVGGVLRIRPATHVRHPSHQPPRHPRPCPARPSLTLLGIEKAAVLTYCSQTLPANSEWLQKFGLRRDIDSKNVFRAAATTQKAIPSISGVIRCLRFENILNMQ